MKYLQSSKNALSILLLNCALLYGSDSKINLGTVNTPDPDEIHQSSREFQLAWQRRRSIIPQPNSPHLSISSHAVSPRTPQSPNSSINFEPIYPETHSDPIQTTTARAIYGNSSASASTEKILRFDLKEKGPEGSRARSTPPIPAAREQTTTRWSTRKQFCTCLACIAGLTALNLGLTALNLHYLRTHNSACHN